MLIGGLQPTTLLDYPDKIAAIVFTAGCNFRCGFCYNPELVIDIQKDKLLSEEIFFKFLAKKKKVLDAVVVTGGEPTRQQDLPRFIKKIKDLGFLVKLDSNGTNPQMIEKLIKGNLIDYIAMDIKAPLAKYDKVANIKVDQAKIKQSIKAIMTSGLSYEFRSTILPALHSETDIMQMAKLIKGADKYFLQKFRAGKNHNDMSFAHAKSFTDREMNNLAKICREYVKKCSVR